MHNGPGQLGQSTLGEVTLTHAAKHVLIVNKRGLHARASAKFVGAVALMPDVQVMVTKDSNEAGGGSILGLMMLGAAVGDTVEIRVSGNGCEARLAELVAMIEDGFGEDR